MRPTIWVCKVCGRFSPDKRGGPGSSLGWDASCVVNAVHCYQDAVPTLNGYAAGIPDGCRV